jgi:hypothetical protein
MTINIQRLINVAMVLITWSTLPFLGLRNIKRFLPATLLIVLFEIINAIIGKRRKWWVFYNKPKSHLFGEFPFHIGPFFVTALWIFKSTYGNFGKYILTNGIVHAFFAFPLTRIAKRIKWYTLDQINEFQFFLYFFYQAFLLYGFQYLFEKNYSLKDN